MQKKLIGVFCAACVLLAQQSVASSVFDSESFIIKNKMDKPASAKLMCSDNLYCGSNLVKQFYQENKYTPVWSNKDGDINQSGLDLIDALHNAYLDGLDPRAYHIKQIDKLIAKLNDEDDEDSRARLLASLDMTLTDGFLLYANNMYYGIIDAKKAYPFWQNVKKPISLITQLNKAIDKGDPKGVLADLAPTYPGYAKLKEKLNEYQKVAENESWGKIPVGEAMELDSSGSRVEMLQRRLEISGELGDDYSKGKFDQRVQKAVTQFQYNNGIYDDGVVESETLRSLNLAVKTRIRIMELNMDKMRLLPQDLSGDYILVNLPEYGLNVYKDGKSVMAMDVAVGGTEHPSCVLNSKINSVVLNPYWNIPAKIAETEIWPILKTDPAYLERKHIDVLQKSGNDYTVVKGATKLNWSKFTTKEFNSYRYRQAPGVLNALGKVKFLFPNQCEIYLHDSNESEVFDIYRRDFSHGCIRVGEPKKLTSYVLGLEKNWSDDKIDSEWNSKEDNRAIAMPKPLNLYIVYFTSWVSSDDWVQFRRDIYGLDKLSPYAVYLPPAAKKTDDEKKSDSDKKSKDDKKKADDSN